MFINAALMICRHSRAKQFYHMADRKGNKTTPS